MFCEPKQPVPQSDKLPGLQYYNQAVHRAAFALPEFARARLEGSLTQ